MDVSFEKSDVKFLSKRIKGFHGIEPAFHPHMEIIYVVSGSIEASVDGIFRKISPGELCISFPYSIHSFKEASDTEAILLLFDTSASELYSQELISKKPASPYIENGKPYLPLLEKILKNHSYNDEEHSALAKVYLSALLGELLLSLTLNPTDSAQFGTIRKILTYCSDHYNEDINIKKISDALFISQSTISKIFSNKLNCTFRDYINQLRIKKAEHYLKKTDMKITDIIYSCGFKNQSSFNRIFLQMKGVTPLQYRKNT